jgi:hypothetical protein
LELEADRDRRVDAIMGASADASLSARQRDTLAFAGAMDVALDFDLSGTEPPPPAERAP